MGDQENPLLEELIACRQDVFRVCLGFSRNAAEAEDLCRDVYVKALSRAGRLCNPAGLRADLQPGRPIFTERPRWFILSAERRVA